MRRLFALALLTSAVPLAAQTAATLPTDSAVRAGRLPNGLRYWIRHNATPAQRLELRLVVRAGSVLEDDDQRGLAHFVEHMAFNGTTRFRKNELVHYLESIGVRFGADLNASTGFDETIYILPVPTDKPQLVERAFDILQDWAGGVRFDAADVAGERGVVLGEWRSGLGAGSRIRDKEFPLLFQGSRYAERLPIGDTAVIAHATPAPLRRFYRDWYRPDLMAVIAVGDVPVDRLEALIRSRFGKLTAPRAPRVREVMPVPEVSGTRVSIVTDPELTSESVQLLVRRPSHTYRTEDDERRMLVSAILSTIGNQRLGDVQRRPDAPFVSAFFGPSRLVRDIEVFALGVTAKDGRTAHAFEAVLRELRRLGVHGVLSTELERAKASILRGREQVAAEQDKTFSANYVGTYIDAFLNDGATPSARARHAIALRLLPTITLDEVNAAVRDASRGTDRFVAVRAPERDSVALPDRAMLLGIIAHVDTLTLSPWVESVATGPLVPTPPPPGRVASETTHAAIGVTEWRLANGVRVLIKPTDFKADQVLVSATSPGGLSLVPDADLIHAGFATALVRESGYGAFDAPSLRRRLAGKVANVAPTIDETTEGFNGFTSPKDIDTFFEVLWLAATEPRYDTTAIAALLSRIRPQLANRDRTPFAAFSDTITLTIGGGHPRALPLTLAQFETIVPARAFSILRDRFADYSDFTFVIVGNVDLTTLRPQVERWLGALPASGRTEQWRDVGPPFLAAPVTKVVRKGKEPVAQQLVLYAGPADDTNDDAAVAADAVGSILETRLLDALREAMGATYGVQVSASLLKAPRAGYVITIAFTAAPAQVDSLWTAAQAIISAIRRDGPTAAEVSTYVEKDRRDMEVAVKTNDWWIGTLIEQVEAGDPIGEAAGWSERIQRLTAARIKSAAHMLLDPRNVARFVLLPEAGR